MCSASTSKWRRSAARVSERPKPSVPSGVSPCGTKRATMSGTQLDEVGGGDHGTSGVGELRGDERNTRGRARVQAVPAFGGERVGAELLVARHAPDVGADPEALGEESAARSASRRIDAAAEELRAVGELAFGAGRSPVHAAHDPVLDALRHRRHLVVLVVERDVVEDVLVPRRPCAAARRVTMTASS